MLKMLCHRYSFVEIPATGGVDLEVIALGALEFVAVVLNIVNFAVLDFATVVIYSADFGCSLWYRRLTAAACDVINFSTGSVLLRTFVLWTLVL